MKKLILMTLLGAFLASCNTPSYQLTGSCMEFNDGDTVYINTMDRVTTKSILIDSCVVKNGQFHFQGRQDSAIIVNLITLKNGKLHKLTSKFFLENGDLVARGDSIKWSLTGSPHNDIYQKCNDELFPHLLKMWPLFEKVELESDTILTEEQRREYRRIIKEENEAINQIKRRYFEANLDNIIGLEFFYSFINTYDPKKQKQLTDHFHALYPDDYFVNKHKERIDKQMKTIVGEKFTDYTMRTPEGKQVSLSEFVVKNKYTLVDVWASWCTPYSSQKKELEAVYQTYKDKGLEIVGVSLDTDSAEWVSAIREWGMPWPQMSDLKGWKSQVTQLYAIESAPHLLLIGQDGTIIARNIKARTLDEELKRLLE